MAQAKEHNWTERDIETLRELHAQRSYVAQKTDEHLIAPIAPSPSHWIKYPGEYDVYGVDYPEWRAKKQMEKRSEAAQSTDLAKKAPLAPTPEEWAKHPDKYDLPGVDTKQKKQAKEARVDEPKNPMGTPDAAKKYLGDVVQAYRKKLGVGDEVKLHARNRGTPAKIVHSQDGKAPRVEVNYRHFGMAWERDPQLTKRYLEYMVAHEMAHQKQLEELGFKGLQKAHKAAISEVEADADAKAFQAIGVSEKDFEKTMDRLAKRVGGTHTRGHPSFKGKPDLGRFKDHTPPEKPQKAGEPAPKKRSTEEIKDQMKATYGKVLNKAIPSATQHEKELIAEKAIAEEWVKASDTAKTAEARVTEKAKAELVKIRQEKAVKDREEQLKALKERSNQAQAKKTDEGRLRERLAKLREDYGAQYEMNLGGALSQHAALWRRELYKALQDKGYSREEAAQISSTFTEDSVRRIRDEALAKARKEIIDLADDSYGEAPELWEEAVKKTRAAEMAERHAKAAVEAAYNDALGSVRDRTEPAKPVMPIVPKKPTVKTSTESYDFYADPGHGWLRVPLKRLEALGIENDISPYSYVKGGYAYLEEDSDAVLFTKTLESLGVKLGLREHTGNRESSIRRYQPYRSSAFEKAKRIILEAKSHTELEGIEKAVYKDPGLNEDDKKQLSEFIRARSSHLPDAKAPATMSPTEEARKRYDATMTDRVPRMAKTWRLNLGRALTDQGFTVEEAEKYMNRLTAETVHQNQSGFIQDKRMASDVVQMPEVRAERDALAAVQNEYEKLKKQAFEEKAKAIHAASPTYDAETEKIIRRIMDQKEVSRVLVEKRIEEEKAQKAGLITNEAAATFVAHQMLGEPEGKTPWAKISMNQMGGIYRIDEYSPTQNKVLVEHIGFKTREEAQAYVNRVNNPAGSETLPSLKKATAFSPEYIKDSGMYEVEVYNPETREKTVRRFSTPDKAEQYRRLINENPGWPMEGFKERQGLKQGKPKYLIIARNVKSRGEEAIKYEVYDRDKSDRNNQNIVNRGTIEYKEAPGKDKIIEDLILEAPKGTSYEVEFTLTPHWTPALSEVERIAPASPSNRNGKWMVWFKNRVGRDMDTREGIGTRSFDTHGEALGFIKEGRGRYGQGDFEREGIWLTVPDPPILPSELESFPGKQSKYLVDPRPRYEGTWNPDKRGMDYRWVFENQIGGQTHTLDQLKEEHQKGEWKTRDRAEAAKSSKTITKQKGASRKSWDWKTQPLAQAMIFHNNAVIEAEGDKVAIEGMDQHHVALMKMRLPNDMGIPEGKYEVADSDLDKRVTHLRHPNKVKWDNVERSLSVGNEGQESHIRYEKVHEFQNRFPIPKVAFDAKTKLDIEALKKAADELGVEHIALKVTEGRSALDSSFTYEATKWETRKFPPDEEHAYEREERVEVPVSGTIGEVDRRSTDKDEARATYTASYISDGLGALIKAGFRDATLEYATDMPLKIVARRDDGAEAEFWLAPCIGV